MKAPRRWPSSALSSSASELRDDLSAALASIAPTDESPQPVRKLSAAGARRGTGELGLSVAQRVAASQPASAAPVPEAGPASADARDAGVDGAVARAHASAAPCYLKVTRGLRGMQVYIDGKPHGTLPLSAPIALASGKAPVVVVRKPGFEALRRRLEAADRAPGTYSELPLRIRR